MFEYKMLRYRNRTFKNKGLKIRLYFQIVMNWAQEFRKRNAIGAAAQMRIQFMMTRHAPIYKGQDTHSHYEQEYQTTER